MQMSPPSICFDKTIGDKKQVDYPAGDICYSKEFKSLVQHYDELTSQQARLKTKLKARLRMQGVMVTGERLYSSAGRRGVLAEVKSSAVRTAISQLYAVLDQSVASQTEAKLLMLRAARAFPEIKVLRTAPGVGRGCLSLQCLHSYTESLQHDAQAVEVLPVER
jgi:hypothetical protein